MAMRIAAIPLAALALAAWVCTPRAATQQRACLPYEPKTVELRGRLTITMKYGPPNYGENPESDQKLRVPILALAKPVDICADSSSQLNRDAFHAVREIQVVFSDTIRARRFADREIVVVGTLSEAISGHHFTDVLLAVSSIREAP